MVTAHFKDGREVTYTDAVLNLLITDSDVEGITDAETGEVLFTNDEGGTE